MLSQEEMDDSRQPIIDGYRGNQTFVDRSAETLSRRFSESNTGEKVFPVPHASQNLFRFAIAAMSMVTLIALVVICLLFIGGVGGWISFIIAGCIILGVAITTTNGGR